MSASDASDSPPPPQNDWFSRLFGFEETKYDVAKKWLTVDEEKHTITSKVTGQSYACGKFTTPTLQELREACAPLEEKELHQGQLKLSLVEGDVSRRQADPDNRLATFQAASQFNCLEFVNWKVVPEDRITGYASDKTQGPACSISAGPATAYRNYFAQVPIVDNKTGEWTGQMQTGQTAQHQVRNLLDINKLIDNLDGKYFEVANGYTLGGNDQLALLNQLLEKMEAEEIKNGEEAGLDRLRAALRVGLHDDVQVTSQNWGRTPVHVDQAQIISQVFGSACSVTYSGNPRSLWAKFSKIILEASYEATLRAALLNAERHEGADGSRIVYLTLLGGGVFGNEFVWIADAITRACQKLKAVKLDVRVLNYRGVPSEIQAMYDNWKAAAEK